MEPINFAGALWRSWRLLLVLAVVGAAIALVLPIPHIKREKPVLRYASYAIVGTVPRGGNGLLGGGGITGAQIAFYANSAVVLQNTAKAADQGIPDDQVYRYMSADLGLPRTSGTSTTLAGKAAKQTNVNDVTLNTYGTTKSNAETLANVYAYILGTTISQTAYYHEQAIANAKASAASGKKGAAAAPTSTSPTGSVNTGFQVLQYAVPAHNAPIPHLSELDSRKIRLPLGFVLGAVIGALLVVARLLLDRRVRTPSRAAALFGFPVLVEIPERPRPSADERPAPIDVIGQPTAPEAEAFRMLRMSVLFEALAASPASGDPLASLLGSFGNGHGSFGQSVPVVPSLGPSIGGSETSERRVVLVVSPRDEETRPVVAANLAAVCAEARQRVVVVSTAELQSGRHTVPVAGSLHAGDIHPVDVEARLESTRAENISRLPLPLFLQHGSQLVTRGREIIDATRSIADVIVIETPALLEVHHAEALSHSVDVVLVVAQCGVTRLSDARRAGDLLRRIGAPVLGVVLTDVRPLGLSRPRPPATAPMLAALNPPVIHTGPAPTAATDKVKTGSSEPTAPTQV